MVLRRPKTLTDESLLQDEPFKTAFARRNNTKEMRKRADVARSPEQAMIQHEMHSDPGGLDAAVCWLTNALGVSVEEAATPNLLDTFIEFYWLLFRGLSSEAETFLRKECKARKQDWLPDLSKPLEDVAPAKKSRKKRRKYGQADAYGADVEDNRNHPIIATPDVHNSISFRTRNRTRASGLVSQKRAGRSKPQATEEAELAWSRLFSGMAQVQTKRHTLTTSKKERKRKANKQGASSPSATSAEDVPIQEPPSVDFDSESSLTPLSSDDEMAVAEETPEESVSAPAVTAELEQVSAANDHASLNQPLLVSTESTIPSAPSPAIISAPSYAHSASPEPPAPRSASTRPSRSVPHRQAANRLHLAEIMEAESRYHQRAQRGLYDDVAIQPSKPSASDENRIVQPRKKNRRTLHNATRVSELPSLDGSSPQNNDVSHTATGQRVLTAMKPTIKSVKGSRDISSQVAKRRRRNDKSPIPIPAADTLIQAPMTIKIPARKARPSEQHSSHPALNADICLPECPSDAVALSTSLSPSSVPGNVATNNDATDSSQPLIAPRPQTTRSRKRDRAQQDAVGQVVEPVDKAGDDIRRRLMVPLPPARPNKNRLQLAPTPSLPVGSPLAMTFETMDTIIRDAATASHETLNCTVEPASDWEADKPDEHPSYDSDEDAPPALSARSKHSTRTISTPEQHGVQRDEADILHEYSSLHDIAQPDQTFRATDIETWCDVPEPQVIYPKLPLKDYPPIWAESRQEVCESFDWFRSYQGGVYFIKGQVKGYLLSAFSASRDIWHNNGQLIISHGGGKAESVHKHNGQLESIEASDQLEEDKSVRALLQTYRTKRPLVLLIDDKYRLFPFDLSAKGCTYVVLGWYHIAHAWAEYQPATNTTGKVVRYKFAFQWCEGQGQPWWNTGELQDEVPLPASPELDVDYIQTCRSCGRPTPQVYEQGWMCLRPRCKAFWRLCDNRVPPRQLTYAQSFLQPVIFPPEELEELKPSLPIADLPDNGITTSRHFCKGWHCRACGRLSSRYKWEYWECRSCQRKSGEYGRIRSASEFRQQTTAKTFDRHWSHPSVIQSGYEFFSCGNSFGSHVVFILPHNRGRIHLLLSPPLANKTADNILIKYQEEARSGSLKFRRWPMRAHKCRGTLLTNYFSQNTGEPYQYVGGADNTVPWEQAPTAVVQALDLIKLRMEEANINLQSPFNEVLSAAYMEEQKMAFHSDSERGLGPVVASLSLGASAYMYFRLHARHALAEMEEGASRDVLKLFLRHGDVIVMEGDGVQAFYEHTVVPLNFRVAATARYIGTEHH